MKKQPEIDIEYVARLARLELNKEEKELFSRQLGDILDYINKLNELDTSNVDPTAHVIDMENVMRSDKVEEFDYKKRALKNAPELEDDLFIVPPVIE